MEDQIKGALHNLSGKVQEAVGSATGDAGAQVEGKARQAAGRWQQKYGEALDTVRDTAVGYPLASLAVVAGVGFLLGALWARRD